MFDKIVPLLLLCTCFWIIKSEGNNTISIEIRKKYTCLIASVPKLTDGAECSIEVLTPYFLESSRFSVNDRQILVNPSDQIIVYNNITFKNNNLELLAVYTYKFDVLQNLTGQWQFVFTFLQKSNMAARCETTVSNNLSKALHPEALTKQRSSHDYTRAFYIVIALFGFIVSSQTIYIVYMKYQTFGGCSQIERIISCNNGRYRDISKRPQQPLPLEIYDNVAPEPIFTNKVIDLTDERPLPPIVSRKPPRVLPPHPDSIGCQIPKKSDKRTPKLDVVSKPPAAMPLKPFGQTNNMADKRMMPNVARNLSQENRLSWDENWDYETLAPAHKYL